MSHRINARLDDALARKVEELCKRSGQSTSDVIKAALEAYYEQTRLDNVGPKAALERAGFIGCAPGEPELSVKYKDVLMDSLHKKT